MCGPGSRKTVFYGSLVCTSLRVHAAWDRVCQAKRCADLRLDTRDPGPRAAGRRSTRHVASTADRATKALLWVHVLSLPHDVEINCTSKEREVKLNFPIYLTLRKAGFEYQSLMLVAGEIFADS